MANKQSLNILVVGCGDVGKRVAKKLLKYSHEVSAISHRTESQDQLNQLGIKTINTNLDEKDALAEIDEDFDLIFYFAPPPPNGIIDTRVTNFLHGYLQQHLPKRVLYISTTGVYGNHDNAWIDENTPTSPENDRSRRRLNAEQQIRDFATEHKIEYVIIRVAGIYSLEKLPLARLQKPIEILACKLASASNRIHADDLCEICLKAMLEANSAEIYNAADGHPSTMPDYFIKVAKVFNLPLPIEVDWQYAQSHFSPAMLSYLKESKKISTEKITQGLKINLRYPTLEDGLAQCLEQYKHEKG